MPVPGNYACGSVLDPRKGGGLMRISRLLALAFFAVAIAMFLADGPIGPY